MEDNSSLSENLKKIIGDAIARFGQKLDYRTKRAVNEAIRNLILSVLPFGKGNRGMKCHEIVEKIKEKIGREILPKKVSQMLQVLKNKKPPQVQEKNGYWKRVIPKAKPIV